MRKLVLPIVAVLAVAAAAIFGWRWWSQYQRESRYAAWREELLAPPPADDPLAVPDEARRTEVVTALKRELREDPGLTRASELLADLLIKKKTLPDGSVVLDDSTLSAAKVVLDEALKHHPEETDASLRLAKICRALRLIDESIKVLSNALVHAEGALRSRVELDLANAYLERYRGSSKEEDFRAARNGFQNARGDPATEADALHGYGVLWLDKGRFQDYEKALAAFRELLKKYPSYSSAKEIQAIVDVLSKPGG